MNSDIRPPGPPKTKTIKKMPRKALIPDPVEATPQPSIDLNTIKPLVNDTAPLSSKRVSLGNIRGNLHPKHWYNLNKEEKIVLFAALGVVFLSIVFSVYFLFFKTADTIPKPYVPTKKYVAKPITVAAPLTGLQIDPALAKRPVTGIMIENSIDARPQSGLQDAGVIYEAIAEGGITRFIALFQDTRPAYIGPVRSLRPYYIDFATPFDASIAHVGGSPEALNQIRGGGKDLDQFFNSGSYWRQSSRPAPHNVYTDFDKLDGLNQSKGYTSSIAQSWERKTDKALKVPTAKTIDVNISSSQFNSHYDYNATSNSYLRSEGGQPHNITVSADDKTGQQLHPKVVIALVMSYGIQSDGKHSEYGVNGSGNVYIFQDGGLEQGTWTKIDRQSQFIFKDAAGKAIKLNAGQTWLTAVGADNMVNYAP